MKIINGQVFDVEKGFINRELYINGTFISAESVDDIVIDAKNCYVIPGLIDLHFHGAVGEDFSEATPEGLQKIADYELSEGVTYICPAGMTLSEAQLTEICKNTATFCENNCGGAEVVGAHLEGPFLSKAKKGAQNEAFLHDPDIEMLRRLQTAANGYVKIVTVAPEQPNGIEFVQMAAEDDITVSLGHTVADYATAKEAFAAGASQATHLYNGMLPLHHRDPGVIGAAFDTPHAKVELICDGIHIHESVVRSTFQMFGANRVILISDSLRATGMPDGLYPFGGQKIEVHGNCATIAGHPETLAGSVTSVMGCVRKAVEFGISLHDAVLAASLNPAQALKIDDRAGSLNIGKEASIVLLNKENLTIQKIIFKGKCL